VTRIRRTYGTCIALLQDKNQGGQWGLKQINSCCKFFLLVALKGLSHVIDFKNVDENRPILALIRAAAGF
jgi:hypothetical protein